LATRVIQSVTTHASTTRTLTPQTSVPHLRRLYRQQLPATAITTYVFLLWRKCPVCLGEPIRMSARPFPRAISMPCRRVSGLFLGTTRGPEPGAREKGRAPSPSRLVTHSNDPKLLHSTFYQRRSSRMQTLAAVDYSDDENASCRYVRREGGSKVRAGNSQQRLFSCRACSISLNYGRDQSMT
jgi:hypothetical protein